MSVENNLQQDDSLTVPVDKSEGLKNTPPAAIPFDWAECVAQMTDTRAVKITKAREYREGTIKTLAEMGLIGVYNHQVALPVKNGCHFRRADGKWGYSEGASVAPWVIGGIEEGAHIHVFESPWDAIAYVDATGEFHNVVATLGASNYVTLCVVIDPNFTGTLYLWPQNDEPKQPDGKLPGYIWANQINKILPLVQMKLVRIPDKVKDLNDWRRAGATLSEMLKAYSGAQEFKGDLPTVGADYSSPHVQPAGSLKEALESHVTMLKKYMRFKYEWQPFVCALWAAHTWVYDCFDYTPYLHVHSPETSCGKTNLLDICAHASRAAERPSVTSEAALYILVEKERPTIILDEIDTVYGPKAEGNEPMRAVINSGFEVSGMAIKAPMGKIKRYGTYCPKAFGGIGGLPDTIGNRSIHIALVRQNPNDKAPKYRSRECRLDLEGVRAFYKKWSVMAQRDLRRARPIMPDELDGRQIDIGEVLVAIADMAGGDWPEIARQGLVAAFRTLADMSTNVKLLASIKAIFDAKPANGAKQGLSSTSIIEALCSLEDANAPWPSWWEKNLRNNEYRAPAMRVAQMLEGFGIRPHMVYHDQEHVRGYYRADFEEAWLTYLPAEILNPKSEQVELELK